MLFWVAMGIKIPVNLHLISRKFSIEFEGPVLLLFIMEVNAWAQNSSWRPPNSGRVDNSHSRTVHDTGVPSADNQQSWGASSANKVTWCVNSPLQTDTARELAIKIIPRLQGICHPPTYDFQKTLYFYINFYMHSIFSFKCQLFPLLSHSFSALTKLS